MFLLLGTYLNIIKATYDKPTANIILSGEKLKAFTLKSGTRQGCPLSPLLFSIVLEVLTTSIIEEKKNKRNQDWKRRSKILSVPGKSTGVGCHCLLQILYIENPKDSTRKLLELVNEYSKVSG